MKEVKQLLTVTDAAPMHLYNQQGNVYATISWHQHYIYVKWQGHITSDDVIAAAKAYLKLIEQHPCAKLFNDKSEVTGDWLDANDWLEFDWMPKVYKAGLRCMAHIYSNSMFSQLSAQDFSSRVVPPLQMATFTDFTTAEQWLLACNPEKQVQVSG